MIKADEFTYAWKRNESNARGEILGRRFILRAIKTERKDFHEVYSILKLLEALGGLYTSLSFIIFIPLVIASKLFRYGGLLLMGCHHDDVFEPAEDVVKASTETPAPEAATSSNSNVQDDSASRNAEVGRTSHNAEVK